MRKMVWSENPIANPSATTPPEWINLWDLTRQTFRKPPMPLYQLINVSVGFMLTSGVVHTKVLRMSNIISGLKAAEPLSLEIPPRKRTTRKNSWSQTPNSVLERRASGPHYFPRTSGGHSSRDRSRSLEQPGNANLLSTVLPLDWLFTDSEPDPPSSPKQVGHGSTASSYTGGKLRQQQSVSSSQGSIGTDTETKTLLGSSSADKDSTANTGAIPKKHLSHSKQLNLPIETSSGSKKNDQTDGADDSSPNRHPLSLPLEKDSIPTGEFKGTSSSSSGAWRKRAFRRRPTAEREEEMLRASRENTDGADPGTPDSDLEGNDVRSVIYFENISLIYFQCSRRMTMYFFFRRQIIDILSAAGNQTSELELEFLKAELKKRRTATDEESEFKTKRKSSETSGRNSRQRRPLFLESRKHSGKAQLLQIQISRLYKMFESLSRPA